MPRARRTCRSCPSVTDAGQSQCERCRLNAARESDAKRERGWYSDAGHRAFRAAVLDRDPICVLCKAAWSTDADHYPTDRRALQAAGLDMNDPVYGRGLCHVCHSRETARLQPGGWHADRLAH